MSDSQPIRRLSPLLQLEGAVANEDESSPDYGTALHYSSPSREERALLAGQAFTDLSHCEVLQLTGPDRISWLNSLTTQKIDQIQAGESTELLLLDPNGHLQNAVGVFEDGVTTWLIADSGWGQPMADFLTSMKFMMRVEVSVREDLAILGALGTAADSLRDVAATAQSLGSEGELPVLWRDPWPGTGPGSATYGPSDAEHPARERAVYLAIVERKELLAAAEQLITMGLQPAGTEAWEAVRVTSWRPRPAMEIVERALPHELDWLRTAVHLEKGCYRGQETVAKLINLGRPPRRLVMLYLEGPVDELPNHGDVVVVDERVVGTITSAVRDSEDGPVALALVRRNVPADRVLEVGNFRGGQQVIVDPGGKSSVSPSSRPGAEFRGRR